jgi:hypothetical protein
LVRIGLACAVCTEKCTIAAIGNTRVDTAIKVPQISPHLWVGSLPDLLDRTLDCIKKLINSTRIKNESEICK